MYEQEEDNKAIVYHFYEEVWNEGNLDLADELISPNFVNHGFGSERGSDLAWIIHETISRGRSARAFHNR